jgi:sarcosine oxidase
MRYDAIVAGVGGMGSATLFELARRGLKVLGLEQFDIPHALGSSHGHSRIIRLAYAEHPGYVPLLRRAYALWRELERASGERLLLITGGIDAGAEGSATVRGSLASCALHNLPHEQLDAAAIARRYPGYRLPEDMVGVYQPDAGMLDPERCVVAHAAAARALGAEVRTGERVTHWHAEDGGVRVETNQGVYRSRKLVITAGPWARSLVPSLNELAVPERQVVLWTEPLVPAHFSASAFPVFNMAAPEGRYYGYPAHDGHGFKIGKYHHRSERVDDPDHMDRESHAEDEAVLRAGVRRYFPDADGPTLALQTCLFTNSPDEHFILDVLPGASDVAVAAGFSGHGFKFCSVVGEIMADLALDGATRHDVSMFRLDRFQRQP